MKKDETIIGSKIEIDEVSGEPTIVEVPMEETEISKPTKTKPKSLKAIKPEDVANMSDKEYKEFGKQLVMSGFIGYDKNEHDIDHRKKVLKRVFSISFVVIVVAVLAWTLYNDFFSKSAMENPPSLQEIRTTISGNWYFFPCALLSLLLIFFLKGFKLSILCKKTTGKFRLKTCIETGIIGLYYNNVTPLAVGGQPFEIYHLSTHGVHGGEASSLPIAAYFLNQTAMALVSVFALVIFRSNLNILNIPEDIVSSPTAAVLRPMATIGLIFELLLPALVIAFCLLPRLCSKFVGIAVAIGTKLKIVKNKKLLAYKTFKSVLTNAKCIKKLAKSPLVFISTLFISFLEALALSSIAYFTLKAFGFNNPDATGIIEWSQIVCVCLVLYAAVSFIPTPGNLGAVDLSFYWLFKLGLVSVAGLAFPAMITWRILSFYSIILVGIIFTSFKRKADKKRRQQENL